MASSGAKKRKRDAVDDGAGKIALQAAGLARTQLGPVLAGFPALKPPPNTAFQCYSLRKPAPDEEEKDFADQRMLVGGEAATVDFLTATQVDRDEAGCSYYVAVHNKRTKTTTFRPAPLHIMQRQVKALKGLEPAAVSAADRMVARNQLGYAFGTKKAQAQIRSTERNKVDVAAIQDVADYLQDRIAKNTDALPTKEEAVANADAARLIPRYNMAAEDPGEVYALHDIIPETEFKAIPTDAIIKAPSSTQRNRLLPYWRSTWVNQHLHQVCSAPKPNKAHVKMLVYISAMFAFRNLSRKLGDKQALHERLSNVPPVVVDGLLSRFSEAVRGTNQAQSTSQTETKMLTHMFALCLRIDDYATDTSLIASDLSMPTPKVDVLYKTLGCKMEKLGINELKRLGLPDSAGQTKRAVLKVPLEFPKPRMKRKTGGR